MRDEDATAFLRNLDDKRAAEVERQDRTDKGVVCKQKTSERASCIRNEEKVERARRYRAR